MLCSFDMKLTLQFQCYESLLTTNN